MEYVYELDLPPISEVFNEGFSGFDDEDLITNYQFRRDLDNIFKKDWLNFRGINWNFVLYFKKDNKPGDIHTDIEVEYLKNDLWKMMHPWGINWVWDGDGLFEYWNFEDVEFFQMATGSHNGGQGKVQMFTSNHAPIKTYKMTKNKVYLVNGALPHRATGFPNRRLLSLRSHFQSFIPWETTVNKFNDLIVTNNDKRIMLV